MSKNWKVDCDNQDSLTNIVHGKEMRGLFDRRIARMKLTA